MGLRASSVTLLLLPQGYASGATGDGAAGVPYNLKAAAAAFRRDGIAVLPGFADKQEVKSMRSAMEGMVQAWWQEVQARPDERPDSVFTTGENQSQAQAKSRYFFDSAARVHYFEEAVAAGAPGTNSTGPPRLNKVGHGLHLDPATPFGVYSRSAQVAAVAKEGGRPHCAEAAAVHSSSAQVVGELRARGFVPLPVTAGDLVVFAGTLDHLSMPNESQEARHTFQLHVIEGEEAGVEWATENWLQLEGRERFLAL